MFTTNELGVFGDSCGNKYVLIESVRQIVHKTYTGTTIGEGAKSYKTSCGIPVNVKNGVYITWNDVVLNPVN